MKLSIIIVSYNVKYFVEQCLHSVLRSTQGIDSEIFVVDNASSDGSVNYLKERFPSVSFFANPNNVGFARANNQALRLARGEYVLLLNPDTLLGENTLADCIHFLDTHPDAGGTGVKMLKTNGDFALESRRGLPTPFTAMCKMTGLCQIFPKSKRFGRYYMRYLDKNEPNKIDVISGAFACFRHSALNEVGFLDEDFFMYGEDIDLSYRVLKGGYQNYYLPSPIVHYKGESTEKSSFRYVHVFYQAMLIFFNKHYGHYRLWLSIPIKMAIYGKAFMAFLGQQVDKIKSAFSHDEERHASPLRYLLVGQKTMLLEAAALLAKNGQISDAQEINEQTCPEGHLDRALDLRQFDVVVYDTDAYRYQTIFNLMERTFSQGYSIQLGTYSTHTKVLITHQSIFV